MKRRLSEFAQLAGGQLHGDDREFADVVSDSRSIKAGELFVALRGPRFDGHEFIATVRAAGAAGALVESRQDAPLSQIVVGDTQAALQAAAHGWRRKLSIPVVGVAGSNGKTTVKEMTAAILSQAGSTLATRGNLNNHIGVPLTLLRLEATHRFAVIEMGANRAGEVAALAKLAEPSIGIVTNAGAEHLEGFGSIEGAARAEGEMVEALPADGTAVINADDAYVSLWRGMTRARVVTFGLVARADYTAKDLRTVVQAGGFRLHFTLTCPAGSQPVELALGGRHNVLNALAASAAAVAAGASLAHCAAGLASMRAVAGRLQLKKTAHGAQLIDDSYNANPSSVRAGLEVLADFAGRRWLVLGDMGELCAFAAESHQAVGTQARELGVERLFAVGPLSTRAVEAFGSGAQWFADTEALARAVDT